MSFGISVMTRRGVLSTAIAMFLQCICSMSYAGEDRMSFTYKADTFKGVMEFRLLYADGPFVTGTAKEFASFIKSKQTTAGAVVIFNSPGGIVSEALELGRAIRAAGFDTDVGVEGMHGRSGECYSACTLAFLGGG
jgi:hypothetical protein